MTKFGAEDVADAFRELGGLSDVKTSRKSELDGTFRVELWHVNAKAGNHNLTVVDHLPRSEKEFGLLRKKAIGKANEHDAAALTRMVAERQVDAE